MKRLLLTLLFFSYSQFSIAAQTCTTSQIGPSGNDFDGISGTSDSNVIAVGENGTVYIYDGSSWSFKNAGTSQDLNAVSTLSTTLAYAVGDDGTIKIYNGTNWSNSISGTSEKLQGVWAYSATEVFAVGEEGKVLRYNGSTWSDLSAAANTGTTDLEAAWGNAANFYALGKNGNLYVYNRSGDSWSTITTCASAIGDDANALWGDNSGNIYLAIDGGAVYKYNGSTCIQVATASDDLNGIFGSDTSGEIYAVGDDGLVVFYNGTNWVSASEGSEDINAVWVSSTGNAYYAADTGFTSACTLSTGSGSGASCTTITTSSGEDLDGISGSSKTDVIGVGKDGEVWSYNGTTWTASSVNNNPIKDLDDVYAIDSTNSVAVGDDGTVLLETNGVWDTLSPPTSKDLRGVWAYSVSEIYVFGKEGAIHSYDGSSWTSLGSSAGAGSNDKFEDAWGNNTYVYGLTEKGELFRYTRSNGAWLEITTCAVGGNVQFEDLWGDGSGNIYFTGDNNTNGVVYKYNGTTCSLVATATDDLKGIYGSTSTGEIYAVGKNGYTLYYNGTTWTEVRRGTEDLNDVWVASDGTPFYSGDGGTLTTCSISSSFDHFLISHDGTALTCEPESITITACANAACTAPHYTSSVSVSLSPTGWVGGDTQTMSGGSSTFQLSKTTAGSYTLNVASSSPAPSDSTTQCVNSGASNTSCDITFYNTGFIYDVPNLTSCATSANVTVSAVRLDNTSQACVPTFQSTTKTIKFGTSFTSPSSGTKQAVLNNGTTNYTLNNSATTTDVPLSFNASGQATITLAYPDAGQLSLNSSYTSGTLNITGSDSFIAVPAKLYVYSDDANSACASNDASCSVFKKAGENFNLKVRAACADNSVTPNFVLNTIAVTHDNTAPNVAEGTLTVASFNMASGDSGEHTITTQSVSEVGVFTFTATSPTYFGLTGPVGTSTYIGRFTPDHFCVSSTNILNRTDSNSKASCTDSFSYLSEDFTDSFTITAQKNGATCGDGSSTTNYTASFSKFDTSNLLSSDDTNDSTETGILNFAALDTSTSTNLSSRINFNSASSTSSGAFSNGQLTVNAKMDIARNGSGPSYTAETVFSTVNIGIKPTDTDNITLESTNLTINSGAYFNVGNTALYFGRLYADNTFGAEQEGLPMWAEPQYCNAQSSGVCSDWKTKTDDTCSLYTINSPVDTIVGVTNAGTNGYWISATDYSAPSGISYTTDLNNHKSGWRIWYTGGGTGGSYVIPFVTHPYLATQDGSATFGLYRGDDRIIYWREMFN